MQLSPLSPLALVTLLLASAAPLQDGAPPAEDEAQELSPAAAAVSAFAAPLYLDPLPPPVRSVRNIQLVHTGVPNVSREVTRTPEEAEQLAAHIVALLRSGEDFGKLAIEYSAAKNAGLGAVLGTFPPGLLAPRMDEFLYAAEIGEVSEPIATANGVHVLQRIESFAATLHIHIRGKSDESKQKIETLLERARAGEDFAELAHQHSQDKYSADRGGQFTIFERGPKDRLLKEAAFSARVGEVVGPIASPVGFHLIKRVPIEGHDPALFEDSQVRIRAILISHDNTALGGITAKRNQVEARQLADDLHARIVAGEDMEQLARQINDDLGGLERGGDIGWVHRHNPRSSSFLDRCFQAEPGELLDPILTNLGWVILRREL
ncbi:MAG: peptidylprolyl isomerase [Planctomycetota bacterium]